MSKIRSINDLKKKEQIEIKQLCESDIQNLKEYSNNYLNNFIKIIEKHYNKENKDSLLLKKQKFFNNIFVGNRKEINNNKEKFLKTIYDNKVIENINNITNTYQKQINKILGKEIRTIFLSTFKDKEGNEQVILTDITEYKKIYERDRASLRYKKINNNIEKYLKKNKIKEDIESKEGKESLENLKKVYSNIKKRYEIGVSEINESRYIPVFYKIGKKEWSKPFFISNLGYLAEPYVFFFFDEKERNDKFLNKHSEKMVESYLIQLRNADNEHGLLTGDISNNLFSQKNNIETQLSIKTPKAESMKYMPVIETAYWIVKNCEKTIDKNGIINQEIRKKLNPSGINHPNDFNEEKFFELSNEIAKKKGVDLFKNLIANYEKNNLT